MISEKKFIVIAIALLFIIVSLFAYTYLVFYGLKQDTIRLKEAATNDLRQLSDRIDEFETRLNTKVSQNLIAPNYGGLIKVAKVIDGDTIELENGERLRYIGIDTPESNDPRKPVQCFAKEATEKNRQLVEGKTIKFYKDINERDKYQRLLGYVYREDGLFINLELVKTGYAFSYTYPPDISKQAEFQTAEQGAREKKLGLWAGCTIIKNEAGRSETNSAATTTTNQ